MLRSTMVMLGATSTMRTSPRTLFSTWGACDSRMQTAAPWNCQHAAQVRNVNLNLLFDFPDPRRIASRPLACKASTIAEGAAVPSIETSCSLRLAVILLIPVVCQANDVHRARPSARTTQVAERPFDVFDAGLTGHRHCKCGFKCRYSHRES